VIHFQNMPGNRQAPNPQGQFNHNVQDQKQLQGKKQGQTPAEPQVQAGQSLETITVDPRYRALTCYNCGESGHFVGICKKLKVCYICSIPGHYMTDCLEWKKPQPITAYMGSASSGLGSRLPPPPLKGQLNQNVQDQKLLLTYKLLPIEMSEC
jgi:hypothetical protein